jgi:hypothetical protein
VTIVRTIEATQVASIAVSNAYGMPCTDYLKTTATNGATATQDVSVDSTAQFISAHYDTLFRRLAD